MHELQRWSPTNTALKVVYRYSSNYIEKKRLASLGSFFSDLQDSRQSEYYCLKRQKNATLILIASEDLRLCQWNAKSKSFLSKILLSKNSRKYPRTAAVGKKGKNV